MHIGIIGLGVVGSAVKHYLDKHWHNIKVFDVNPAKSNCDLSEILETDIVFVSVPTPYEHASRRYDLKNLMDVLTSLYEQNYKGVVVHKCTVLPQTTDLLQDIFHSLRIVHFPEFLTERNAKHDFRDQKTILLSGKVTDCQVVNKAFKQKFTIQYSPDFVQTELAKLIHNSFLATKVAFFNEMYKACARVSTSYSEVLAMAQSPQAIGRGHVTVPGPDGKFGFAGMCFVKDTLAFVEWGVSQNIRFTVLESAIESNKKVRPEAYNGIEKVGVS